MKLIRKRWARFCLYVAGFFGALLMAMSVLGIYLRYVVFDEFDDGNGFSGSYEKSEQLSDLVLNGMLLIHDRTVNEDLKEKNFHNQFINGCSAASSLDGEKVYDGWQYYTDRGYSDWTMDVNESSYKYVYSKIEKEATVFVSYDSKTNKLTQWYKDEDGHKYDFEYIDSDELTELTDGVKADYVYGISGKDCRVYSMQRWGYSYCDTFDTPITTLLIGAIVFILCVILIILGAPSKLILVDRFPYIIWGVFYGGVILLLGGMILAAEEIVYRNSKGYILVGDESDSFMAIMGLGILIFYLASAACVMHVVRRIKCQKFWDGFIVCRLIRKYFGSFDGMTERTSGSTRLTIFTAAVLLINAIFLLAAAAATELPGFMLIAFLLILFDAFAIAKIFRYRTDVQTLLETSRKIENGELDAKVDVNDLSFDMKEMGESLNSLGDGLSKAVESSLRDERTKAELITNVSHDIKTPLTSIINYVDLLKKEDIDNEKAREYIDVLEKKADRLKMLILDLIEASKTSTGNIELEYMKLSFSELVNQCSAEYEDKFAESGLELVKNINDEGAFINADGRRVFRIIDNILNNAVKYAQPGTRVYLDLVKRDGELILSLKNTSKEMLNISAEELTERFVRGDRSRNSEGSGLGLSIAKNLTELQGGRFEITVDGDLFKVDVAFPQVETGEALGEAVQPE